MLIRVALLASLTLLGAGLAQAQDVGQHPAVFAPRKAIGVDPSTFTVGHPASPTWRAADHANFRHPAFAARRYAASHHVDANTFLVQPPAHADWLAL